MPRTLSSITVGDLRRLLGHYPEDQEVIVTANYGDYSHTPQALPLEGDLVPVAVVQSGYSQSGFEILREEGNLAEPDELDDEDQQVFLLLR